MTQVQEIESAISRLSREERWSLLHRFSEELWKDWDEEIQADLASGRLDSLLAEARTEIASGKSRPLHEVIGNS